MKKKIIVLLPILIFLFIIPLAILLAYQNYDNNNIIKNTPILTDNITIEKNEEPIIEDEIVIEETPEEPTAKEEINKPPTTSVGEDSKNDTNLKKENSSNSNTNKQETNTSKTTSTKEEPKNTESNQQVETNDKKEETNNSTGNKVWEQLGMSEYDYYNKPIWTWATKTHNTLESCVADGEKAKQEELEKNSGRAVLYTCHHLYSHSGNYVGEMIEIEYLG